MTNLKSVREQILKKRGVRVARTNIDSHKKLVSSLGDIKLKKTPLMRAVELEHREPILDILTYGSLRQIEKKYGIDYSTASKWRKELARQLLMMIAKE